MRPRDRRVDHATVSLKSKALSAATVILAEQGAERLSLRAIADLAGIGIASMYHYFENKDALLLQLATQGFEDLREDILAYRRDPEFAPPMRVGQRAFFAFAKEQPALFSLMFDERLMARHEALREAEHHTFLAYEAAVKANGRIPSEHEATAALALWALGRGMAAIMSSYPRGQMPDDLVAKLFAGAAYLLHHPD
jgi:AcrR family transcriptional regulator